MTVALDGVMEWKPSLEAGRWERMAVENMLEAVARSWLARTVVMARTLSMVALADEHL